MVRVDLHVHSSASFDCAVPPEAVAKRCRALGIWPVFLTDHDSIDGCLELRRTHPDGVVTGQEITTQEGELIGLFIQELIAPDLTVDQAVASIKAQGGLVYLQHPYDRRRRSLSESTIEKIADQVDIVEVFNGRSTTQANSKADELRLTLGAAPGAGSDSHELGSIGAVYIEMEPFDGPRQFLANLAGGRIVAHPNRALLRLRSALRGVPTG